MILSRTLTRKSKMNFGKWKDCTVQEMFDFRRQKELVSAYYKLSSINYTEDILFELGITKEWVIEKPSTDKETYIRFLKNKGMLKVRTREGSNSMKKEWKATKRYNQSKNHGK